MKSNRGCALLGGLLLVAAMGGAAWLDRWFMGWRGNRARNFSLLNYALGDGQKLFASHFYRKADIYFHSGMYPSIFDNNESFRTAHIGEDAGTTGSKNTGNEDDFLGGSRDIIDRFSRNFFPSRHTHLDEGGVAGEAGDKSQVREILPWLKITQQLDPENPLTYSVTAYWLRVRMNKLREAEQLLREGLRHLPNHPVLLFELGRLHYHPVESRAWAGLNDPTRARNIWQRGLKAWQDQEAPKPEPDRFMLEQLLTHLAQLEEDTGNLPAALAYWQQAAAIAPERDGLPQRVAEVQRKLAASSPP